MVKIRTPGHSALWIGIAQAVLVLLAGMQCARNAEEQSSKGPELMDTSLRREIASINPNDNKKLDSLVGEIRKRATDQSGQLVGLTKEKDLDDETLANARLVLLQLGDVAMPPLLDSLDSKDPDALVWDLQTVVGFHRDNQARIVKRLQSLIGDKRKLLPKEQGPFTEEKIPERRVCDEAYLLMRRLLALEDEEANMVNARIFLYGMTEPERDREIMRLVKSQTWISLTEQSDASPGERE